MHEQNISTCLFFSWNKNTFFHVSEHKKWHVKKLQIMRVRNTDIHHFLL